MRLRLALIALLLCLPGAAQTLVRVAQLVNVQQIQCWGFASCVLDSSTSINPNSTQIRRGQIAGYGLQAYQLAGTDGYLIFGCFPQCSIASPWYPAVTGGWLLSDGVNYVIGVPPVAGFQAIVPVPVK